MAWCMGWMVSGVGLAVISLFFLDRYVPKLGTFWNVMYGEVTGVPYPYILLAAAGLVFYGLTGLIKEYDKESPFDRASESSR